MDVVYCLKNSLENYTYKTYEKNYFKKCKMIRILFYMIYIKVKYVLEDSVHIF